MMTLDEIEKKYHWSEWRPFPRPDQKDYLCAPYRFGVYQIRNSKTNQYIMFGEGGHLAHRMSSILPEPHGIRGRKNEKKRQHVWTHLASIEYRTVPCLSKSEALQIQQELKSLGIHLFNT